ncbi:uncharacterized protein BO96DRAFT_60085 [Aspergillus niger CBS 101883]|uniref:uncharacterized protein n=1 Tax=Aspergillus lacticoffeatus (strain CBS 101883) TaxID=1450533 RepID=UPI000D8014D7|nr:uncharacterized protein BO96DRAFT_60085 [Aspergillus niger CBS 101883]PYH56485.1 hypothetical protein BO96DRAFT_60085 [Aspergillus niger CBS 101883]
MFFLPFVFPLASKQATKRASFHLSSTKTYRLGGFVFFSPKTGVVVVCYLSWRFVSVSILKSFKGWCVGCRVTFC